MNRLKELRTSRDLTQKQVAQAIGISPKRYGQIESGKVKLKVGVLIALACFYNTSTDYIAGLTDEFTPHERAELNPRR